MSATPVYVVNKSTLVKDADVITMCAAISRQILLDAAPAYGLQPTSVLFTHNPPAGGAVIALVDTCDDPQALGYHTEDGGVPDGFVGCKPELDAGHKILTGPYSVASILSHEVLELFVDPHCNLWADTGQGFAVAYEVADPCQSDTYNVNGVSVSNFVHPAFFDPAATAGSRFDHLGLVTAPFQLRPGGYWVQMKEGRASQRFGDDVPDWMRTAKTIPASRGGRVAALGGHSDLPVMQGARVSCGGPVTCARCREGCPQ